MYFYHKRKQQQRVTYQKLRVLISSKMEQLAGLAADLPCVLSQMDQLKQDRIQMHLESTSERIRLFLSKVQTLKSRLDGTIDKKRLQFQKQLCNYFRSVKTGLEVLLLDQRKKGTVLQQQVAGLKQELRRLRKEQAMHLQQIEAIGQQPVLQPTPKQIVRIKRSISLGNLSSCHRVAKLSKSSRRSGMRLLLELLSEKRAKGSWQMPMFRDRLQLLGRGKGHFYNFIFSQHNFKTIVDRLLDKCYL